MADNTKDRNLRTYALVGAVFGVFNSTVMVPTKWFTIVYPSVEVSVIISRGVGGAIGGVITGVVIYWIVFKLAILFSGRDRRDRRNH